MKTENTSCTIFSVTASLNKRDSSNSSSADSSESECKLVEAAEVSFSTPQVM